ncbi:MAG TPA: aldo/keto reductase [Acidobacteriota bacterium]|nr:aldo/keto reductase [Acidobacteriota bacterium]
MVKKLNRRKFIGTTAAGIGAVTLGRGQLQNSIPRRVLGRTGAEVSILGFGGGSRFLMYEDEDRALEILNRAIDMGINYLDTAMGYGNGRSEERYGKVLKTRRNEVFLTTKVSERGYDAALRATEASLKRLQTDHVDLLHIHSLGEMDDLAEIEKPDGVLKALYRIRDEKMARFIGITSHTDAETMKTALERHDFNCVMMALNAATDSGFSTGFERIALPVARRKNLGILAMKITGQETLLGTGLGKLPIRDLLYYSMSLPVAACIVGMPKPEYVMENIELARQFKPLSEPEKKRIQARIRPSVPSFHAFMSSHRDDGLVA